MSRPAIRALLWAAGIGLGLASAYEIGTSETVNHGFVVLALIVGWSFIASGLVALARRPDNRFGLLLYAVGMLWLASTLDTSRDAYVFAAGLVLATSYYAVLVHAILAYPRGRLESRLTRAIVVAGYADTIGVQVIVALTAKPADVGGDADSPRNVLLVSHHPDLASALSTASAVIGVVLLALVVMVVAQRWRAASAAARRILAPVLLTSGFGLATVALGLTVSLFSGETVSTVAFILSSLAFASVPVGFLVGILRTGFSRSGALKELIDELGRSHEPDRVLRALRRAVGDPSLELAYWIADLDAYVDADGHPVAAAERPNRAVTVVERSGRRVAALLHDPVLGDNRELVESVCAAAGLALENEQLQADLRARLGALEESERRFRDLLENVHLIAVRLNLDGEITFCNQYLADLAGYERDELIGRPWTETFNPLEERFLADARRGVIPHHDESYITTRSGERREIAWNNTLLRDASGRPVGLTGIGEDVTDRNRTARRLLLQVRVARALTEAGSLDEARPHILEHLTHALQSWVGILWRPDAEGKTLRADWCYLTDPEDGSEFAAAVAGLRPRRSESVPGRVWATGRWEWVPDIAADGFFPPLPPGQTEGLRGTLGFPVISDGEVVAVLQISSDDPTGPDPGTIDVLESTFQHVLQFVERREAEAAERRLAEEQAALRRVATLVAAGASPTAVFQAVTTEVGHLFDARTANMLQFGADGTTGTVLGGWTAPGADTIPAGSVVQFDGPTAIKRVYETGLPTRVDDYEEVEGELSEQLRGLGVRASVAAPITVQGKLWGAMAVVSGVGPFPPGTERRIAEFTDLVALALASTDARSQLAASRARIVEAGDAERRRLERNLHDGAQQRLVSLSLALRLARSRLSEDPEASATLLAAAGEELATALEELRELARGIHPAILTDRGLAPALEALAARTPVPVNLRAVPAERLPGQVEAAAYYVVSESLANVAKYARASSVDVAVVCDDGWATVEVCDDGVGGADAAAGSGLRGLADRVEALDGHLVVDSPDGAGTRVLARIPCR